LILLVGMHRSGTSLLGSLLPHLGVRLPGELIPGDAHNPEGYQEWRQVVDLQERLLIDLDRFWAGPEGARPLPRGWQEHPDTHRTAAELRDLLRRERDRQPGPWAIKDPRSSVLLPLWRELAAELGLPLRLVLAVRDPEAVVASVMARDERLAGMTWWRAQQLWWRFTSAPLTSPSAAPVLVVHYERWFEDAAAQARALAAGLGLAAPTAAALAAITAAIRPQHRRQQGLPAGAPPLDRRLRNLHALLKRRPRIDTPLRLARGPLQPRRPPRQALAHRLDLLWLWRTPLLDAPGEHGLPGRWRAIRRYRARFLQGEGAGALACLPWITARRPGLLTHHRDPIAWYLRRGWRTGTAPHPLLQPGRLWRQTGLRREAAALYRRLARREGLSPHPRFDPGHYLHQCRRQGIEPAPTPLEHYLREGWRLGLAPHPWVDPGWMAARQPRPGEPLTLLALAGGDPEDPRLTHPGGLFHAAAAGEPGAAAELPRALADLLRLWHQRGLRPAAGWLGEGAFGDPLPRFDLVGPIWPGLFADGLWPAPRAETLRIATLPPAPGATPLPWRAERLLAACGQPEAPAGAGGHLRVLHDPADLSQALASLEHDDGVINLLWPPPERLAEWIGALRAVAGVLDPDPERTALLQRFGVPAAHRPPAPPPPSGDPEAALLHAQLHLGLPDPAWLVPEGPGLELAVLGSGGAEQERRWGEISLAAAGTRLLLLPRLNRIELASLEDAQALQGWLERLAAVCAAILVLEPPALGAVSLPPGPARLLGPDAEPELLELWEGRSR
jgi:hypothetical protein